MQQGASDRSVDAKIFQPFTLWEEIWLSPPLVTGPGQL